MTPSSYTHKEKDLRSFKVFAIEEGTVIDHIDAGQALHIIKILNLEANRSIITVGLNLPSKRLGAKDIIKVEFRFLTQEEANRVAIFAPTASINIIKEYQVAEKFQITIPKQITGLIVCPNPYCITNYEQMQTVFVVQQTNEQLQFQCRYCEKLFVKKDITEFSII